MSWDGKVLPMSFLVTIALMAWLSAYSDHKKISPSSSEAIHLPRIIGVSFGGLWLDNPDNIFNTRGIVLQILIYVLLPILTLMVFEIISQRVAARWVGITSTVLVMMGLMYYFRKRRKT